MSRRGPLLAIRHATEAAAMGLFSLVGRAIPAWLAPRLGAGLGRLAGRLDGRRRKVAVANLLHAYGDELDERSARRMAGDYYAHLGRSMLETQVILRRHPGLPYHHWVDWPEETLSRLRKILSQHGAMIFVTCHGGAWELGGASMCELLAPFHSVFRPLQNPWLNRRLLAMRKKIGMPLIQYDQRALAQMQRLLRNGESIALLADLNQKKGGVFSEFFGRPAATTRAPGLLAVRRGVPVVCCFVHHTGEPYHYRGTADPAIFASGEGSVEEQVQQVTDEITRSIERFVRAHPTQWQWNYKRWKTQPATEPKLAPAATG